jgi:tripeptidyl-peptidase-1
MITMINDARLAIGKGSVGESRNLSSMHEDRLFGPAGFINPAIYSSQFANAFNDITTGNNPGCGMCSYVR